MLIKFIQLNIYKGKYLNSLLNFLKREKPDIICCQEVTTNDFNFSIDKSISLFDVIKNELRMFGSYHGDLKLIGHPNSLFGNAIFSKYEIIKTAVVTLKTFRPVTLAELDGKSGGIREQIPRHLLLAKLRLSRDIINVLSWHGAWTAPPHDTKETLRQAKIVADYLRSLKEPFIMGCDANNILGSRTIEIVNKVALNLMIGKNINQTTHPKVHKIVPRGFLVDFIFCSKDFYLKSLSVPQVLVSDHLPVVAILEN